ncbi:MAG: HNH endonuclease signature motif containing protein [Candidatus Solibacter sp.]|nr:HNH endonuclease signature motif containing protein [Candidatus Solibacter sp.]
MIERLSTNPIIKTTFLLVDHHDNESVVAFWLEIEANGIKLSSQPLPAQVQRDGKFSRAPGGRELWSEETVARLSTAFGRHKAALEARNYDIEGMKRLMGSAWATEGIKRMTEEAKSRTQLELLGKEMATRDFFADFSRFVIPLTCADSSDDRSYTFFRGTVWRCARELEPTQWSLLADRFIEQQPMEVKRFSRKATVECNATVSDRGVEIAFKISALAASFVSSEGIKREPSDDWVAEQGRLRTQLNKLRIELESYKTVVAEVAARYKQSGQLTAGHLLSQQQTFTYRKQTGLPAQGVVGSDTTPPTPDEWGDANLAHINKRLDELEYYRNNAGVAPMPPKFYEQLRQDIDARCVPLLTCIAQIQTCIAQTQAEMEESHQRLSREAVNDDAVLQITSEPVRLTREDKNSELEYALYRGVVWECGRPLLPEQWRVLADSYLAEEETALAQQLTQALGDQPPPQESKDARQGIPTAVRRAVWARDKGRCVQCGRKEWLEYDHIIPVSKGGSNTERNIELLCEACNRAKSDSIR